ncbi:MAG: beta-propeller domain-containing protein [Lachnospiraceae bacterium]|nr:beta-propeller domain-containing protein [Lachnospiraceae bacterium]
MNEKDLLQKIKEDGRNTPIPDSLHPEAIEKMLREKYAGSSEQENVNSAASDTKNEKTIQKKTVSDSEAAPGKTVDMKEGARRRRMRSRFLRFGSAAAVFVLAFGVLLQSQQLKKHRQAEESQDIQSVTENLLARTVQEETENPAADADNNAEAQTDSAKEETKKPAADADNNAEAQTDSAKKEAKVSEPDAFTYAESPKALYQALYDCFYSGSSDSYDTENGNPSSIARTDLAVPEMAADMSLSDLNSSDAGGISMYAEEDLYSSPEKAAGTDFSKTNLQELGVDEGDIVKTDGQFVYILRQDLSFAIVKADKDKSALLSVTKLDTGSNGYVHEMYLEGDTLHIIVSGAITRLTNEEDTYYTNTKRQTTLLTYDISDRSAPVLTGSVSQEGSYETSRKNDGYIYLFTSYSPDIRDNFDDSVIMPRVNDTEISAGAVYLPEALESSTYLVISSIKTDVPDQICDSKVLVSGASHYYVSEQNIYIANEQYDSAVTMTEITKFHYESGSITGVAAGSVKGYLNDSFSMNEYNGKLRVVSTYTRDGFNSVYDTSGTVTAEMYEPSFEEYNALYILDENMQQTGAIENLAEGETIRSARFFGDTGYFVTFEQTDPLFSVDLSDPQNPEILGELKISGFSSYLHPYGENLLLGIGYEADEKTGTVEGLKLSMFDISDPSDVKEVHRMVLSGITWCPAVEDYKSILADPGKNVIGFYCDNRYLVFSYDETNGFTNELAYDFYSDMLINQAEYDTMRGLYIDDTFYLAGNTFFISFDMKKDYEKTALLAIDTVK